MAPALTEAATQARIKLTTSSPPSSSGTSKLVVNGRGSHCQTDVSRLTGKHLKGVTSQIAIEQHQKGDNSGVLKTLGYKQLKVANFNNLRYIGELKDLKNREILIPVSLQNGNHSDGVAMNQPTPVNGISENGDPTGMCGKNGLRTSLNESKGNGSEELANSSKPSQVHLQKDIESQETKMVASSSKGTIDSDCVNSLSVNLLDNKVTDSLETNLPVPSLVSDLNDEINKKQHLLERRTQHLLRRLRRMQGRQLDGHIRNQLGGFVDFQRRDLQTVAKSIRLAGSNISASDLKAELLQSEDVKSLSTAALVNLVRRLQSTQGSVNFGPRTVNRTKHDNESVSVLMIDENTCQESSRVAGSLLASHHHMKSCIDSDATESSSGGESCDENEMNDYVPEKKIQSLPLHRRAEWKWATDRASVASRWTWLQAQVSDLEYRIRQQSEIYKQIRHTKGSVLLGEPAVPEDLTKTVKQAKSGKLSPLDAKIANLEKKNEVSPCNISTLLMNVNRQASRLTQSLGNCISPVQGTALTDEKLKGHNHTKPLNGVINSGQLSTNGNDSDITDSPSTVGPGGDASSLEMSPALDMSCQAARCRPVRSYRKRKLLRTAGLHQISRKAARLSSVKCHCYPPVMSCPMCGGRYNNVQSIDSDVMPLNERVSLVDPAFHPVLSFNQEIPLPVHFESLLQSGEWQNKPPPKSAKALSAERRRQKLMAASVRDRVRKNSKYVKSAAAVLLSSAKLRNKYERRTPTKQRNGTPKKKSAAEKRLHRNEMKRRRAAQLAIAALKRTNRAFSEADCGRYDPGSRATTPSPQFKDGLLSMSSSCPTSTLKEMKDAALKKRKIENAYDINNIVIPYSMAASTRVEKLKYKEIVTPKWRDLTEDDDDESAQTEDTNLVAEDPPTVTPKEETIEAAPQDVPVQNEEDEEIEDLSDEIFTERHLKCEILEKKRFTNFVQYPSRRSRGSRTEIGMPPTPDALSPSPINLPDSNILQQNPGPSGIDNFRRRSSSVSSRRQSISLSFEDNSMDMVDITYHDPWPERTFPLAEEEYESMKAVQPPATNSCRRRIPSARMSLVSEFENSKLDDSTPSSSRPCSPLPSSSSGSYAGEEDPNDPEWTVMSGEKTPTKPKR